MTLHGGPHQAERRIRPSVAGLDLALENSLTSDIVEPFRRGHRQRPQQQRVNEPECRGAGADRQSQRQNRRSGSHLPLHKLPPAEDGVGAKRLEPRDDSDVAAGFALAQRGAESAPRFGRFAALLDGFVDVQLQLFVEFAAHTVSAKDVGDA